MASTSDIKNGITIEFNDDLYSVVEFQHVKPGKGNAFVRTKLKSVTSGKVVDHTFVSGHKIDIVRVERRKFQFLYKDDMGYHFMNNENFEQIALQEAMIESPKYLKEGLDVEILFHAVNDTPLYMDMPQNIVAEVIYTEPGHRGDTATNALKVAKIDTGAEVRVPLFIDQGEKIRVDTRTGAYIERVKS
jgi:elongation factor P